MEWFTLMNDSMLLRTAYLDESNKLWSIGLENLKRWVTQYFVHLDRIVTSKSDGSVNDELGRRFIIEEVDVDSEKLNIPDLEKASQDDIKALTNVFDSWLLNAVGDVDGGAELNIQNSARFCDFLVIDEGAPRSLVDLSKETPPLTLVSREERRARINQYGDSQAVKRFQGVQKGDNYYGWMRMWTEDTPNAWFGRTGKSGKYNYAFESTEIPRGSGKLWYFSDLRSIGKTRWREGSSLGSAPTYAKGIVNVHSPLGTVNDTDASCASWAIDTWKAVLTAFPSLARIITPILQLLLDLVVVSGVDGTRPVFRARDDCGETIDDQNFYYGRHAPKRAAKLTGTCFTTQWRGQYSRLYPQKHPKALCNRLVDCDCTNFETAKDAAFGQPICLAPPQREPAPNEAVPADTTIPTDAAGYSHYTPDPPVSATVGTGKTENCGPWPAAAAGKTCSTIAFPSGATITISLEVNLTLGTVISDWTGRFGGKGDAWRAFPFGVWDGCLGGNSVPV
ncbi:hypothetical protein V494_02357 [Pseudogymnoascus sp. VKM F-4513 (FW-928)]|nr:hypothetical protein V494_02357 [Pseudogymnoascus sp. VKM F-4513 (FW-928)]